MKINPILFFNINPQIRKSEKKPQVSQISNVPNFYIPNLINFRGQENFREELEKKFSQGQDELFSFLDKSFRQRAKEKRINHSLIDDTVQSRILDVLLLMEDFSKNNRGRDWLFDEINKIYVHLGPKKYDYTSEPWTESLDKNLNSKDKSLIESTTEENRIVSPSKKNEQEREKLKKEVQEAISNVNLTEKERGIINKRYSKDELVKYEEIADDYDISCASIWRIHRGALFKIQISNDSLNDKIKNYITDFSNIFEIDSQKAQRIIVKHPGILYKTPQEGKENIENLVKRFDKEGLKYDKYLGACLKCPSLFYQSPDIIERHVYDTVEKLKKEGFEIEIKKYLNACLKQPALFVLSPEKVNNNTKNLFETLQEISKELKKEDLIKACLKQPTLFCQSNETIKGHIYDTVKQLREDGFKIEAKQYLGACLKQPALFCQSGETVKRNVQGITNIFSEEGLNSDAYLNACLKNPSLFTQLPKTIGEHIDILKFSRMNCEESINQDNLFEKILSRPVDITNSSSHLLIKYLIIPKMFEGEKIPKELKGNGLREKLTNYLKENPNKNFELNIKPIETTTDCIKILNEALDEIEKEVGRENIFKINIQ